MFWFHRWSLHAPWLLVMVGLVGCAADPSKPTDAVLNCQQITEEIASQDASGTASEARAKELRPGFYAVQALGFVPYVGDVLGLVEMVSDVSNSRELDRLNANTQTAQQRREYLAKLHATRCGAGTAGSAPVQAVPAGNLPAGTPPAR